jgi:4,5-DOPA dioxygenase extradiol
LREKGVLIIGSGNLVHNLMALAPGAAAYDWAEAFDARMSEMILARDFGGIAKAGSLGRIAKLAHPTPEHFLPLLFPLGVADAKDELSFFNASFDMASISMRSLVLS